MITIIGSSIAGSALAYLLAREKVKVALYEQKSVADVGEKPCAEIVTKNFLEIAKALQLDTEKIIEKKFDRAIVSSPKKQVGFEIEDYAISRKELVKQLIKKAEKAGANIFFKTKLLDFEKQEKEKQKYKLFFEKDNGKVKRNTEILVGADGANSVVARKSGLWQKRSFLIARQVETKKISFDIESKAYYVFLGSPYAYYSYLIPIGKRNNGFRIGMLSYPNKISGLLFKKFLSLLGAEQEGKAEKKALIPLYYPSLHYKKENIFICGDAACMTKATGGGIIQALQSAIALKKIIIDKKYDKMKRLKRELITHYFIRKVMVKLDDNQLDNLLELCNHKVKKVIASRDVLTRGAFRLFLAQPRFLLYTRFLF